MYHGTPEERAELRRTVMRLEDSREKGADSQASNTPKKKTPNKARTKSKSKKAAPPSKGARRSGRFAHKIEDEDDEDEDEDDEDVEPEEKEDSEYADSDTEAARVPISAPPSEPDTLMTNASATNSDNEDEEINIFPVVVTTYEMIIRDRVHLAQYKWGYVVVDEGHRLKNLDCKLMQEIKKYPSAGRMILTGTPLHVCRFFCFMQSWKVELILYGHTEQPR